MSLIFNVLPVGLIGTNCYLVVNDATHTCLVIDPGGDSERIITKLKELNVTPIAILLTHAHVDHISGITGVLKSFPGLPVFLDDNDRLLYQSPSNAIPPWIPAAKGLPSSQEFCPIENFPFRVIKTPGHTQGSVCFYFEKENVLISGDTLFDGAIGRTDLPGGNFKQLVQSITTQLFCLPEATIVYPGHGASTTIHSAKNIGNLF